RRQRPHILRSLPPPIFLAIAIDGLLSVRGERAHFGKSSVGAGLARCRLGRRIRSAPPPLSCHGLVLVSHHARAGDWNSSGGKSSACRSLHLPSADWMVFAYHMGRG